MKDLVHRLGWALSGALAIILIASLARAIQAGPLDPPGPVASTMRTLGDLVPVWDQTLSSSGGCTSQRFSCVMGGGAVLDSETGLVWERTPVYSAAFSWDLASTVCTSLQTGGRFGWRLPTAEELTSLKDPNQLGGMPPGHPFSGIDDLTFWTATTDPLDPSRARVIPIGLGSNEQTASKASYSQAGAWCVRGGQGVDAPAPYDLGSWSKQLAANDGIDSCNSSRFTCVMSNAAVLDHETGLVWQRSWASIGNVDWGTASLGCFAIDIGGRRGWRLATAAELGSLLDPLLVSPTPSLPAGHPFLNIPSFGAFIWSADPVPGTSSYYAMIILPSQAGLAGGISTISGLNDHAVCVRGSK